MFILGGSGVSVPNVRRLRRLRRLGRIMGMRLRLVLIKFDVSLHRVDLISEHEEVVR